MKQIKKLSKSELLSLIYNQLDGGAVLYEVHPVECAACGNFNGDYTNVEDRTVKVYRYICDLCEQYFNEQDSSDQYEF